MIVLNVLGIIFFGRFSHRARRSYSSVLSGGSRGAVSGYRRKSLKGTAVRPLFPVVLAFYPEGEPGKPTLEGAGKSDDSL